MADQIRENDVGTQFIITVYDGTEIMDLSDATDKIITFRKPDYSLLEVTPSFYTDGTDGKLRYISTAGILTPHGFWNLQATITTASGSWSSTKHEFTVSQNL